MRTSLRASSGLQGSLISGKETPKEVGKTSCSPGMPRLTNSFTQHALRHFFSPHSALHISISPIRKPNVRVFTTSSLLGDTMKIKQQHTLTAQGEVEHVAANKHMGIHRSISPP